MRFTPDEFLAYLREQVQVHGSQKALAQHCGVGAAFLSDVLREKRDPGKAILKALGFTRVIFYDQRRADASTLPYPGQP